jgi:hypothetical protein
LKPFDLNDLRRRAMSRYLRANVLTASVAIVIAGCGGHDDHNNNGPQYVSDIAVLNIKAGVNFSFDIGTVSGSHYYFTDRNNASLNQIDIPSKTFVKAIQGSGNLAFTGLGPGPNSMVRPEGATPVGSLIYAGDVNSVKIVDPNAGAVVSKITVSATGVRADEGCLDAMHGLFMISSPEENPPFATFINTTTQAVVAKVTFTDNANKPTAGLEACRYDANTDNFYVNVDGSTANPHGELVKLPGASIRAVPIGGTQNYTALAGVAVYGGRQLRSDRPGARTWKRYRGWMQRKHDQRALADADLRPLERRAFGVPQRRRRRSARI